MFQANIGVLSRTACESCEQHPGIVRIEFPDGATFLVCITCWLDSRPEDAS